MINEEVRHIIEPELIEGEELLWADKPVRGFELKKKYFKLWKFFVRVFTLLAMFACAGLAIAGFLSVYDIWTIYPREEAFELMLAGLVMFPLIGLVRFLFTAAADYGLRVTHSMEQEIYAITRERGLIISPLNKYRTRDISQKDLKKAKVRGARRNVGTIIFPIATGDTIANFKNAIKGHLFNFHNIQNPKDVRELIRLNF